jgi:hypothetical protein
MNNLDLKSTSLPEIEVTTLPSKGLPYPENFTIKYVPYTFGEVVKMSQSKITRLEQYRVILEGVICSFHKEDLTFQDFQWVALLRKLSSIGDNEFYIDYNCYKCMKKSKAIFQFTDISFHDMEAEALPVVAKMSKGDFHFRPLTIGQFFELVDEDKASDTKALLAKMCSNKEFDEAYETFSTCIYDSKESRDGKILERIDKVLAHSIKNITNECSNYIDVEDGKKKKKASEVKKKTKCKGITDIAITEVDVLIRPFRDDRESIDNLLQYGL